MLVLIKRTFWNFGNINAKPILNYIYQFSERFSIAIMENKNDSQAQTSSDDNDYDNVASIHQISKHHICEVWASNFHEEMSKLMKLTQQFHVISMDTEFPGIFATKDVPHKFQTIQDIEYNLIRKNVELTKLIQIGLTIADEDGNAPLPVCTWQFNFKFDIQKQNIVKQSGDLLKKAGIQFDRIKIEGIDHLDFAQYFEASGFVFNKSKKWIAFHGSSDFAYLLRLVCNKPLPMSIHQFYLQMGKYFPNIYDLKYIIKDKPSLKNCGLKKLSYEIGCNRMGSQHQAGSDSLLTSSCYFKIKGQDEIIPLPDISDCRDIIYGIGIGYIRYQGNKREEAHKPYTSNPSHNQYNSQYMMYTQSHYNPQYTRY